MTLGTAAQSTRNLSLLISNRWGSWRRFIRAKAVASMSTERNVIITGANTGIGKETAKALAGKGMNVVMACRDINKAESARIEIEECAQDGAEISVSQLDLADLSSVRDFASRYLDSGKPVDTIINNAGVMATPELQTKDGFELQLGVNHLGHFLLTLTLWPRLEETIRNSDDNIQGRIINVSSTAHAFGTINFDDIMLRKQGAYDAWVAYGQSKLANILFTYELARRLPANVSANTLHPGLVATELGRYILPENNNWWQNAILSGLRMLTKTPRQGAETSIYLASDPSVNKLTGRYFIDCQPKSSSRSSYDEDAAKRLWNLSLDLTGSQNCIS